ncbi:alkaline phosphatase family protein [Stieleria sp. JC731]|uniref:alkaline phosphatase family protein n=1 Tax=Pirellulaceae TaxID=2691357 RepID=UPI001E5880B7|nr:alkaline phosphatase family protein [Stieleria sp. JC731]MCC9602777.1 alkaline phosphatase family protein [Stieleria sp. JC731]
MSKKCILFVIDAMAFDVVRDWLASDRLPNIAKMISRGGSLHPCISIFPSITPAATCSIASGSYPKDHGIEGACWYDAESADTAYFGDDLRLVLQEGMRDYLIDFGDRLNFERLRTPLIYEQLHAQGIESACLNFMWFRGPHVHPRTTPLGIRLAAGKLSDEICGPKYMKLGDFVHSLPEGVGEVEGMEAGMFGKFGFHDETTAACLKAMAEADELPPVTVAYFPLNDSDAHEEGLTAAASKRLTSFDQHLGELVELIGGWDRVGTEFSFIMVGDHSQSEPHGDSMNLIELENYLQEFKRADFSTGLEDDSQLLICPNMRAAAIYFADDCLDVRREVVYRVLKDPNVDQIVMENLELDGAKKYVVATSDRGRLEFWRADSEHDDGNCDIEGYEKVDHFTDAHGNKWAMCGDLEALDYQVDSDGNLVDGLYPNACERIEGAFTSGSSPIWVTAIPGAEFSVRETNQHPGGSHGSLHKDDSISGLIVSPDLSAKMNDPERPMSRITDIMEYCLHSIGAKRLPSDQVPMSHFSITES